MSLADLTTAIQYQLPLTAVVFNNAGLQMERGKMSVSGLSPFGVDLVNPDFAALARACSWRGERVSTENELISALSNALSAATPTLIDAATAAILFPETKTI